MVFVCYSIAPYFPSLLIVYQHSIHTADLICGVVGARTCFWVPVHILVAKFKGLFMLGWLKFCVLMWWEKCLCKGRAGSWSKHVICVFFRKCLTVTSWSWCAGVGHLAYACISFLQDFRSQWTGDLQCLAGNSAGFCQTLHKSWNHVSVLGAPAVLDHGISTATFHLWNIRPLVSWHRVAPLGRPGSCADCPTLWNGESKLSHTTSHHVHQCFHILRPKVSLLLRNPSDCVCNPCPSPELLESVRSQVQTSFLWDISLQIATSCWSCWAWNI